MHYLSSCRWFLVVALMTAAMAAGAPSGAGGVETCQGEPATVIGTPGLDHLTGTADKDVVALRGSSDYFSGLRGDDLICGDKGSDRLLPGRGDDHVYAGPDGDIVTPGARSGSDNLYGGTGRDLLRASGGSDVIRAGADADLLVAGSGEDRLYGWTGDDLLKAPGNDGADDYLEGGPGYDTCHVRANDTTVRCEDVIIHTARSRGR